MLVFKISPAALITTNGSAATETEYAFVKPGATRNVMLRALSFIGRAAGATTIASVVSRIKKWTTTSSSAGTAITPSPVEIGYQAAKATAAYGTPTNGTGGPTQLGTFGCSQGGPGGFVARDDYSGYTLEGGDNKSISIFHISGVVSVPFEFDAEIVE